MGNIFLNLVRLYISILNTFPLHHLLFLKLLMINYYTSYCLNLTIHSNTFTFTTPNMLTREMLQKDKMGKLMDFL